MRENIIKDKSFGFAFRIVDLFKYLVADKNEFIMSIIKGYKSFIKH